MKKLLFALLLIAAPALAEDWPWPTCPPSRDPSGFGRPAILLMPMTYRYNDHSIAYMARLTCRDTGAVLLWTWHVEPWSCNGPCTAAMTPGIAPRDWLPLDVPHVCDGCILPRARAVK